MTFVIPEVLWLVWLLRSLLGDLFCLGNPGVVYLLWVSILFLRSLAEAGKTAPLFQFQAVLSDHYYIGKQTDVKITYAHTSSYIGKMTFWTPL